MKITHILPPLTKGGAERVAVDLANHAGRGGHEVTIVASYPVAPELLLHFVAANVSVKYVTLHPSRFAKYLALAKWLAANRKWLLEQDVVHCHLTFGALAGSGVKIMRRLTGKRRPVVIETYHAVGMPISAWKRGFAALLARGRDGFALVAADDYWDRFCSSKTNLPVRVIPNGIAAPMHYPSNEELSGYRAANGIGRSALIVGTVGRLVEGRMPLRMIDVFAEIARLTGPEVQFFVGGEGELLEASQRHAARLGLGERIHFAGLVERPLLAFGLIDVYVSINVGQITGIAGLEAAACAKPVIALQALDHYDGASDWIWSSTEPAQVAREAIRLLHEPDVRRRIGKAQAKHVRDKHSDSALGTAYEDFYRDCLARA